MTKVRIPIVILMEAIIPPSFPIKSLIVKYELS